MKRWIVLLIFLVLPLSSFSQEKPVVQVDPVQNLSGHPLVDDLCTIITDQIYRTLVLIGRYQVFQDSSEIPVDTAEIENTAAFRQRSRDKGYDNILSGGITLDGDTFIITMQSYALSEDRLVQYDPETAADVFKTRNAADRIIEKTIQEFSGHVTFGSLVFLFPSSGEPMEYTLDGLNGNDLDLERIPSGPHEIGIRQKRFFGPVEKFYTVEILPDQENRVELEPHYLTNREAEILTLADNLFLERLMRQEFSLFSLPPELSELLDSSFFREYRPELIEKYRIWAEEFAEGPSGEDTLSKTDLSSQNLWYQQALTRQMNPVNLSREYPLGLMDVFTRYKAIPWGEINLDGNAEDWEGVEVLSTDPEGNVNITQSGSAEASDIVEVKAAADREFLYFMFRTADEEYVHNWVSFKVHMKTDNGGFYFDIHPYSDFQVWAGLRANGSETNEWESMTNLLRYKNGEILEIAIPLEKLAASDVFDSDMEIRMMTDYAATSNHTTLNPSIVHRLHVPLLELIIRDRGLSDEEFRSGNGSLDVLLYGEENTRNLWEEALARLEQDYPNLRINADTIFGEEYHEELRSRLSSGAVPHVIYSGTDARWGQSLRQSGQRYDIRPFVDESYYDFTLTSAVGPDDPLYVIPLGTDNITSLLYANTLLLDLLGLDLPETYEDLAAMVPAVQAADMELITIDGADGWAWSSCLLSNIVARLSGNPHWVSEAVSGKHRFTDEVFLRSLRIVQRMVEDGVLSEESLDRSYDENLNMYNRGEALFMIQGQWISGNIADGLKGNTSMLLPYPKWPGENASMAGSVAGAAQSGYGITREAGEDPWLRYGALKVLEYLNSHEVVTESFRKGAITAPILRDFSLPAELPEMQKQKMDLMRTAEITDVIDAYMEGAANDALNNGLRDLAVGRTTPEEVAREVERLLRNP